MTRYSMLLAGAAALAFSNVGAMAQTNCAEEIADLSLDLGVAEDGMTTGSTAVEDGIEKDGSTAPLEGDDAADAGEAGDDADQISDMAARGSPGVGAPSADEAHGGDELDETADAGTEDAAEDDLAAADTGLDDPAGADASGGEEIAKDGTTAPLQDEAGEGLDQAASPADTEAEQAGDDVAAADADSDAAGPDTGLDTGMDAADSAVGDDQNEQAIAALDRARDAQAAGNEQECLDAVEEARELHQQ